jgi:poly(3-hydroxybutyrate) depolymerase
VYVAGFSAGAAIAAVMAASHADVDAAVGVHSGLPYRAAQDMLTASTAMRRGPRRAQPLSRAIPVITFHGAADSVVNSVNAAKVIENFTSAGTQAASTTTAGQATWWPVLHPDRGPPRRATHRRAVDGAW